MTPGDLVWIEAPTPLYEANPAEHRGDLSDILIMTETPYWLALVINEILHDNIKVTVWLCVVVSGALRYVNRVWVLETIEVEQQIYT